MDLKQFQHPEKVNLRQFTVPIFFLAVLVTFLIFSNITITPFKIKYSVFPIALWSQFRSKYNHNSSSDTESDCDYSNGKWVFDEKYWVGSYNESCPFLDPGFQCRNSGRPDNDYAKWRWKPHHCDLPRFNATDFLERSRNGQIVFAGDSIGRNQWESLICMLSQGISNVSTIFEENGYPITKTHKGFLSIKFKEYNLTVQYYREPFLVDVRRPPHNSPPEVHRAISVDSFHWFSSKFARADVIIFNTGHWWNVDKTVKMGWYFEEGGKINMTMDVETAFSKSLQTWKSWILRNFDTKKSIIFFRSYSPTHYRNGTWNEGGFCDTYTKPETKLENIQEEKSTNKLIYDVVKQIEEEEEEEEEEDSRKFRAKFLNITYLTEVRKDGHPSRFREEGTPYDAPQDCSHWCLPGVPDTWNQILYAHLLSMQFRTKNV